MRLTSGTLTAFVPCRKGSQRAPLKNTCPFAGIQDGLIGIKLRQLLASSGIDNILISTDDPFIFDLCETSEFRSESRIKVVERPAELATSAATTDALVNHVPEIIPDGHVLWTQVTSPFIDSSLFDLVIKTYWEGLGDTHDSLMTVTPLQSFLWNKDGPVNYDRNIEKWPRTQTLEPLYIINNGIFIAAADIYRTEQDKMGPNPKLFTLTHLQELDIDWPDDFDFCEALWPLKGKI
ncbi:MAG: acylneuraminate cytidylyltransferase family protein [Hellea sp.]